MSENKITYEDIKQYEGFLKMAPSFLLERWAKKNTNLVSKFKSQIEPRILNLNEERKKKLDMVLNSEVEELQNILSDAYAQSNKKQYKILAKPKYKGFIEDNLNEIRKMLNDR